MLKVRIERAWIEVIPDADPETSYLEQDEFKDRREQYERGDFGFVGVRARAELRFETGVGGWILGPTVDTPGLWGIESDSGEDYLREVGGEEADALVGILVALGIERARAEYARRMATTELRWT